MKKTTDDYLTVMLKALPLSKNKIPLVAIHLEIKYNKDNEAVRSVGERNIEL